MSKFVRVMDGLKSNAGDFEYKINEVNIANNWNPTAKDGKDFGGFNYAAEDSILRWLHRGTYIYDVEVPKDAENVKLEGATTIYRTNKIIIRNPRKVDDDLALYYYEISNIPEKSYYKALAVVSIMEYKNTAHRILKDKVNENNIDEVLDEWNDFINHKGTNDRKDSNELVKEMGELLNEIKSPLNISLYVSKNPYIKKLSDDKIINLTGQSGSGKSYYAKENFNSEEYEIIDTDDIFSDKRFDTAIGLNKELGFYFRNKYNPLPDLGNDFDLIYKEILEYCKDINKTIVIDSAQFHCINDISLLRGQIIIIRTDINTCYERVVNRWIENHKNNNISYTKEELDKYKERKKGIYAWYKQTNNFIDTIDRIKVI